jgi:Flp pilus assembly protein TadB
METKTYRDIDAKQAEINSLKQELEKKTKELQTLKKQGKDITATEYFTSSPAPWFILLPLIFAFLFLFTTKLHVKIWFALVATVVSCTLVGFVMFKTKFLALETNEK